jgi:hypothetical protein
MMAMVMMMIMGGNLEDISRNWRGKERILSRRGLKYTAYICSKTP